MQVRGNEVLFGLYEETTFGVDPSPALGLKMYPVSFTVQGAQSREQSNTLGAARARTIGILGTNSVSGTIEGELNAEWFGYILKHMLGTPTPTGAGPYTHTYTVASSLPTSMMLELDYGANISGSGRVARFNGCRVNSLTIRLMPGGPIMFSAEIMGMKTVFASAALDSGIADLGHNGFSGYNIAITEGGSPIATCKSLEITMSNDLDGDGYVIGSGGNRALIPEGFFSVEARGTYLFDSAALLNKGIGEVETAIVATIRRGTGTVGTLGNEEVKITLAQGKYNITSVPVPGPAGLMADLTFVGYKKSATQPVEVVIKNPISTYVTIPPT